ncbi:MAG: hypothetical protein FWH02_07865 [Oscillospiraceae bacterium]|nr:hypothetical protein [Oscillospiraceae bacterium]
MPLLDLLKKIKGGEDVQEGGKPAKEKPAKKAFKYKLSFRKEDAGEPAAEENPPADEAVVAEPPAPQPEAAPPPTKKEKKPKAAKPPKPKKVKKPKVKKSPKPKKEREPMSRKKKMLLMFGGGGGAVLLGGGVAAAFMLGLIALPQAPTTREIIDSALESIMLEDFGAAEKAFTQLIEKREELEIDHVTEAYLGLTDTKLAEEAHNAYVLRVNLIETLEDGLLFTGDSRIQDKIDELTPPPPPDPDAPPPPMPIIFEDEAFERMLRLALENPDGDILPDDLRQITTMKIVGDTHAAVNQSLISTNRSNGYVIDDTLYTERGTIRSLADLAYFTELRRLVICYSSVADISGIERLSKLETLGLYFNEITDLSPIAGMENLQFLYVNNNNIIGLAPVSGLSKLAEIWAQNNQISDLSPVSDLPVLRELVVNSNQITDISPIRGMPKLLLFYAADNQITEITAVAATPSLTDVDFTGNPIADMSPAANVRFVNDSML